jgi:hypothetical protein
MVERKDPHLGCGVVLDVGHGIGLQVEIVPACSGLSPISFNIKLTVCARQGVQVMCSNSRPIALHAFL